MDIEEKLLEVHKAVGDLSMDLRSYENTLVLNVRCQRGLQFEHFEGVLVTFNNDSSVKVDAGAVGRILDHVVRMHAHEKVES